MALPVAADLAAAVADMRTQGRVLPRPAMEAAVRPVAGRVILAVILIAARDCAAWFQPFRHELKEESI